jgi:hypothetical protein
MPEKIQRTITKMNFEVDFIAVKEEQWGNEVIARVVDAGSVGNAESMVPEAVGEAYQLKFNLPVAGYHHTKGECVILDASQPNAWYTHVKVFRKKQS